MKFEQGTIKEELEKAIEEQNIVVYYQPKYNAIKNKINGAEALVRWKDAEQNIISPAEFIPLLEKTGDIVILDWYVLEQVCRFQKARFKQKKIVPIAVNFSRIHTFEPDFLEHLNRIVDKWGIAHPYIEVEITESSLSQSDEAIIPFLESIRDAGYTIAIDDFGSGLSSLSFVKDVPANVLKIDKSLLSHNCEDEKERIVLESIFTFAHRLKIATVAEGVETKEQLGFLRTCGCETIQGFYFAKPMPETEFTDRLNEENLEGNAEDIILTQSAASATQLLLDAVFTCYTLVIMSNLTRNSFYMMSYENFTTTSCPSTGIYTELIEHGASTMYQEDQQLFRDTFNREVQLRAFEDGQRVRSVITRQLGDDGVYRKVETTNYYMKNPNVEDVLAITLCKPLE